jgi:signal transduction histidine kinase
MARHPQATIHRGTVLVVHESEAVRLSTARSLEDDGQRVLAAESRDEALAILQAAEVHVLLLELPLLRSDGAELLARARALDPLVQVILLPGRRRERRLRDAVAVLDAQGYHDPADGAERLCLAVDVALRARALLQRLRERDRLQGELVANCSHEFRTPLNVIGGYAALLRNGDLGPLPPAASGSLERVLAAVERLSSLVSDFLSYARVEAGTAGATSGPIAIATLTAELTRLGTVLLDEKQVALHVDVSEAPVDLECDGHKLRTVLRHLLANAVKFTAVGTITVTVSAGPESVRFAVQDTGCGIPASDFEAIFDPFRQLDVGPTRHYGGVGLGLALSRKLARLLGGDLTVESTVGVGSTFTLVVPAAQRTGSHCREAAERYMASAARSSPTPYSAVAASGAPSSTAASNSHHSAA